MILVNIFENQQKIIHLEEFYQKEINENEQKKIKIKVIYYCHLIYPLLKQNMITKPPYILDFGVQKD